MTAQIIKSIPTNCSFIRIDDGKLSLENIDQDLSIHQDGKLKVSICTKAGHKYSSPLIVITDKTCGIKIDISSGVQIEIIEIAQGESVVSTEVTVEENSNLNHSRIQQTDSCVSDYSCTQKQNSTFEMSTISLCGDNTNTILLHCAGENTNTKLYGLGITKEDEKLSNHIRLYHQKPNGHSHQGFKYIASGHSTAAFDGKIIVEPNAQKIQAYQKNNNILLSPTAKILSDPQLEIYADDVRCSHGSTIGQLDQNAMFYMQSRGIPYSIAKGMLIRSFADGALEGVRQHWLYQEIENIVEKNLETV